MEDERLTAEDDIVIKERTSHKRKATLLITGIILILIGIIALVAIVAIWSSTNTITIHGRMSVVFDVGGSGTRMILYESDKNSDGMKQLLYLKCEDEGATKENLITLQTKMIDCIKQGKQKIPQDIVKEVPVYMAATAGMRLLRSSNITRYESVWNVLTSVLRNASLNVRYNDTLPGDKEASYSWTTINQLQNKKEKSGLFEMGSSSTQIAIDIEDGKAIDKKGSKEKEKVVVHGKTFHLDTISFLCYGKSEFVRRYRAYIIDQQSGKNLNYTMDPCAYKDYFFDEDINDFINQPCIDGKLAETNFGKKIKLKKKEGSQFYHFNGTGNFNECLKNVRGVLKEGYHSNLSHTKQEEFFLGIGGGTVYASKFIVTEQPTNISSYRYATEKLCNMKLNEVKQLPGYSKYALDYCLSTTYTYTLLKDVVQLKDGEKIEFVNKINGKKVGWTLGLALNNEMSPAVYKEEHQVSKTVYILIILICCFFIIVALVQFAIACNRYGRSKHKRSVSVEFDK